MMNVFSANGTSYLLRDQMLICGGKNIDFSAVMTFRNLGTLVYDVLTSVIETSGDGFEIEQIKTNHKSEQSLPQPLVLSVVNRR